MMAGVEPGIGGGLACWMRSWGFTPTVRCDCRCDQCVNLSPHDVIERRPCIDHPLQVVIRYNVCTTPCTHETQIAVVSKRFWRCFESFRGCFAAFQRFARLASPVFLSVLLFGAYVDCTMFASTVPVDAGSAPQ